MRRITLVTGDGIGPSITNVAKKLISATGVRIQWQERMAGLSAFQQHGTSLPESTLKSFEETKVMLKAPLTTPTGTQGYRSVNVTLRQKFQMFANVRPIVGMRRLDKRGGGAGGPLNMVIIRENTEGLYSGEERVIRDSEFNIVRGESVCVATPDACKRLVTFACNYAREHGRKKVTLVHKANILRATSGLFLEVGKQVGKQYPELEMNDLIVDACSMKMVKQPYLFDVIATTNLFGDILSDLAAGLPEVGGLGFVGSANIGESHSMFEAVHGSAPDIAHLNIANPTAMILASIMMLNHIGEKRAASAISSALHDVLREKKTVTPDIMAGSSVSTQEMGDEILRRLEFYVRN
jgi:isocitrate dehydrogenase (NAD+)